jgi:futalosine hydrolase
VTAVEAERVACATAAADVVTCGVGPAAAAAATAAMLARGRYDAVLSAGIGGGFLGVAVGEVVVASAIVFADLGVATPDGFVPVSTLGFGTDRYDVRADLVETLAGRTGARTGTILTVATATGTDERARSLKQRFPDAVAEAMEGAGVAAAAACYAVPYAEVRSVSNVVGQRDRSRWRVEPALSALSEAMSAIGDLA